MSNNRFYRNIILINLVDYCSNTEFTVVWRIFFPKIKRNHFQVLFLKLDLLLQKWMTDSAVVIWTSPYTNLKIVKQLHKIYIWSKYTTDSFSSTYYSAQPTCLSLQVCMSYSPASDQMWYTGCPIPKFPMSIYILILKMINKECPGESVERGIALTMWTIPGGHKEQHRIGA